MWRGNRSKQGTGPLIVDHLLRKWQFFPVYRVQLSALRGLRYDVLESDFNLLFSDSRNGADLSKRSVDVVTDIRRPIHFLLGWLL